MTGPFGGADAPPAERSEPQRVTGRERVRHPFFFDCGLDVVVDPELLVHDGISSTRRGWTGRSPWTPRTTWRCAVR